ncbi:MAG: pantetheine-phosphate adenylyltransferase [Acidobacteria bacterium]|nr:MAG: pantetheine-phosphate adenylyltransferase [Acidobacteriota bacterium]
MKTRAIFPGSFDPVTNGHVDIIARALKLFDEVVVAVLINEQKRPCFTIEERMDLIREAYPNERVNCISFTGLLVDAAHECGATAIIRGLRAVSDFEYECQIAMMNRELAPEIETTFLMTQANFSFVSSRLIKEVVRLGGHPERLVPPCVIRELHKKYQITK